MKIGILTQPLRGNYGGVLQNWALQQVLIRLGHEPVTIDVLPYPNCYLFILSSLKSLALWLIPSRKRKFWRWSEGWNSLFEHFVNKQIVKTSVCKYYSMRIVKMESLNVLVVGSDLTWYPMA